MMSVRPPSCLFLSTGCWCEHHQLGLRWHSEEYEYECCLGYSRHEFACSISGHSHWCKFCASMGYCKLHLCKQLLCGSF